MAAQPFFCITRGNMKIFIIILMCQLAKKNATAPYVPVGLLCVPPLRSDVFSTHKNHSEAQFVLLLFLSPFEVITMLLMMLRFAFSSKFLLISYL